MEGEHEEDAPQEGAEAGRLVVVRVNPTRVLPRACMRR